jgi:hypothetical protein
MDPLPLLFAEVDHSIRAALDDTGDVRQPIDLSCPAIVASVTLRQSSVG